MGHFARGRSRNRARTSHVMVAHTLVCMGVDLSLEDFVLHVVVERHHGSTGTVGCQQAWIVVQQLLQPWNESRGPLPIQHDGRRCPRAQSQCKLPLVQTLDLCEPKLCQLWGPQHSIGLAGHGSMMVGPVGDFYNPGFGGSWFCNTCGNSVSEILHVLAVIESHQSLWSESTTEMVTCTTFFGCQVHTQSKSKQVFWELLSVEEGVISVHRG
eukprot:2160175-Amphidinium_carterae.1